MIKSQLIIFFVFVFVTSSPLVQPGHQRFQFSAPEGTETRAPGLAQLASQGGSFLYYLMVFAVLQVLTDLFCVIGKKENFLLLYENEFTNVHTHQPQFKNAFLKLVLVSLFQI